MASWACDAEVQLAAPLESGASGPRGPLEWADAELRPRPRARQRRRRHRRRGARPADCEPLARVDPSAALPRRVRRRLLPGRGFPPAARWPVASEETAPQDFKLQVMLNDSRGVGKTSPMERFTNDTGEACKSPVGKVVTLK